jgi:branched-chain amino acid transport system permease protein
VNKSLITAPNTAKFVCLLILIVLPLVIPSPYIRHIMIIAFIYAIVASNWDLSLGYGGIFNFGHIAFFALGAYASAILSKTVGITPWVTIPMAGGVGIIAALIVSLPVLRLKGIYVVLVTFAFSQLCFQLIISQSDITGGTNGMPLLPPLKLGDYNFARDGKFGYYYAGLFLLVVSTIYLHRLVNSKFGTSIVALRDNEDYAISRGISLARQRLMTMALSAAFTAMAGGFYASYVRVASPEIFGFGLLSLTLSMLLLGGTNSIYGPIVGAFLITLISEAMIDLGPWRFLIIAALIVLMLVFYPGGVIAALRSAGARLEDAFAGTRRKGPLRRAP